MEQMPERNVLLASEVVTLGEHFLSQGIQHYLLSKLNKARKNISLEIDYANTSIMCSFIALEHFLAYYKNKMFSYKGSKFFVEEENRNELLKMHLKSWRSKGFLDRYKIIYFSLIGENPNQSLMGKLYELSILRNYLFHGYCFQRNLLIDEYKDEVQYYQDVVDYENFKTDEEKWNKDFQKTKFHMLDFIDCSDASKALEIVLENLKPFFVFTKYSFGVILALVSHDPFTIDFNKCSIESIDEGFVIEER